MPVDAGPLSPETLDPASAPGRLYNAVRLSDTNPSGLAAILRGSPALVAVLRRYPQMLAVAVASGAIDEVGNVAGTAPGRAPDAATAAGQQALQWARQRLEPLRQPYERFLWVLSSGAWEARALRAAVETAGIPLPAGPPPVWVQAGRDIERMVGITPAPWNGLPVFEELFDLPEPAYERLRSMLSAWVSGYIGQLTAENLGIPSALGELLSEVRSVLGSLTLPSWQELRRAP